MLLCRQVEERADLSSAAEQVCCLVQALLMHYNHSYAHATGTHLHVNPPPPRHLSPPRIATLAHTQLTVVLTMFPDNDSHTDFIVGHTKLCGLSLSRYQTLDLFIDQGRMPSVTEGCNPLPFYCCLHRSTDDQLLTNSTELCSPVLSFILRHCSK